MSRQRLDPGREARFWDGVAQATRFFMGEAGVQRALDKIVRLLGDAHIPTPSLEPWRSTSTVTGA